MSSLRVLRDRWLTPEGAALAAAVRQRIGAGESLSQVGLGRVDHRIDVRGLPLTSVVATPHGVSGSLLAETLHGTAWLRDVRLVGLDLTGARLDHLRFTNVTIDDCVFDKASCLDWRLWDSEVRQSLFVGADLRDGALGTHHDGKPVSWSDIDFSRANLGGSFFQGSSVARCTFATTRLDGVEFVDCELSDLVFSGPLRRFRIDLRGRRIPGATPVARNLDFAACSFADVTMKGFTFDTVALPPDPDLVVIRRFSAVVQRHVEALSGREDAAARRFRAVVENELRGGVDPTWDKVLNLRDVASDPDDPVRALYRALADGAASEAP